MVAKKSASTAYDKEQDERIKKLEDKVFGGVEPDDCGPNPDPANAHIKEGGWGGDTAGAATWESIAMSDPASEWKVVDKQGVNIAHHFVSEEEADQYISYHRCLQEQGGGGTPPEPEPGPEPVGGDYPYPAVSEPMTSTQRGPTERNYASGKPSDWTIEQNVKKIPHDNHQWVVYVTVQKMDHDDNISLKFGGVHMGGKGWYDCGVSIESGQLCLGSEPKHPSTNLCVIKGDKIGNLIQKKVGLAGCFWKKENRIELWYNLGQGWEKGPEGTNVDGLKPQPGKDGFETQLRIDGFSYTGEKDETDPEKLKAANAPIIHSSVVTAI